MLFLHMVSCIHSHKNKSGQLSFIRLHRFLTFEQRSFNRSGKTQQIVFISPDSLIRYGSSCLLLISSDLYALNNSLPQNQYFKKH